MKKEYAGQASVRLNHFYPFGFAGVKATPHFGQRTLSKLTRRSSRGVIPCPHSGQGVESEGPYLFQIDFLALRHFEILSAPAASGNGFSLAPDHAPGCAQHDEGGGVGYELQPNSPYKNAGTDGRDLGADIVGLEAALTGVE